MNMLHIKQLVFALLNTNKLRFTNDTNLSYDQFRLLNETVRKEC